MVSAGGGRCGDCRRVHGAQAGSGSWRVPGEALTLLLCTQGTKYGPVGRQPKKSGIARVTFDLYKLNPKDFLGCLNVKATMYEAYSVSYEIRCTGAKALLR